MHEHVESLGDDRRGAAREERGRTRPDGAAVGEDVARARLVGRHRLLRTRAADSAATRAWIRRRRLRLYNLHRQLRSARTRDLRSDRSRRSLRVVGAVGKPQLRGPHPPRLPDELPRVAAAGRRVRARGLDGCRPRARSVGSRSEWRSRVSARPLALGGRGLAGCGVGARPRDVRGELRDDSRRRRQLEGALRSLRRPVRLGPGVHVHPPPDLPRTHHTARARAARHRGRACARAARRQRDHRPHLSRGRDPPRQSGRPVVARARCRAARVQLLRLAARQSRSDGARHLRQRPPAQPARARHRGRRHAALPRR